MKAIKKIIPFLLIIVSFLFQQAKADFLPGYTNSIKHYGIGAARVTNVISIYEAPDLNSKLLNIYYWNGSGVFGTRNKFVDGDVQDLLIAFAPKENMAFFSVEDETDDWIKICYNQKKQLFGWIKKENNGNGAKFYPWGEFFNEFGKKYGIYVFRNLPPNYKKLYGKPGDTLKAIDDFNYAKHISPWLIRGNWMLVKVVTYDGKTKTGWFRWRSDDGRLYVFVKFE